MLEETTANNCGCTRTCPKKSGVNFPFVFFLCVFICVSCGCSNGLYLKHAGKPRHNQIRKTLPLLGSCVPKTPFHVFELNKAKASTPKKIFDSLSLETVLRGIVPAYQKGFNMRHLWMEREPGPGHPKTNPEKDLSRAVLGRLGGVVPFHKKFAG